MAGTSFAPATSSASANTLAGNVHGGQQPVAFATLQLWAVGGTGDGSAAQPLLPAGITTDGNGNFTVTGEYTCPSPNTLVYMSATGGNPGLPGNQTNNNLSLMAALGACGTLSGATFITINEVTTVGAVMALHPYMLSYATVGSGSADASGLANAFATAAELVNTNAGAAGGSAVPSGSTVDTALINTLADILANCVNSAGGVSGDGSLCGNLFALAGGAATTDTVAAALYIANYPTLNVAALFNLLSANGPFQPVYTSAPASFAVVVSPGPAASNYYALQGQQFLAQLQTAFLQTKPAKNFSLPLYASDIDPLNGTQLTGNAPLFTQENLIRAFYWGSQVYPSQFTPLLTNSINQLAWNQYQSAYGQCFGTTANATCFFDDNAQLAGTLTDVYLHVLPTAQVYTDSTTALNYVLSNTDAQGGIPQTPAGLGQGSFYMNPAVESGQTDVNYGTIFGNSSDVTVGLNYFNEVNNPALGLINSAGLFIGGTTYNTSTGTWTPNKVGPLPGESVNVSLLALALYRNTGNSQYLQYAENLTGLVVNKFVAQNGGVSANAANGGYGIVDLLCHLYIADHNTVWFNDAQNIIDFLLTNDRDTGGYFANGTTSAGNWNNVRTGQAPAADTVLLTQAATAAALLEFAYTDLNYPPSPGTVNLQSSAAVTSTGSGYSETLTVTNTGTAIAPTVLVTTATLGSAQGATLPALLGDIPPGYSASVTLTFPSSAGGDNTLASAVVGGTYIGGTFNNTFSTTLP